MKTKILSLSILSIIVATLAYADSLTVHLEPTQKNSLLSGTATFDQIEEGLKVTVEISEAAPGKHGIHIHENGSCDDMGNAAGSHFNPDQHAHGDAVTGGIENAHAGDLGNIEIDAEGNGKLEKVLKGVSLKEGKYAVQGRALILHEKEDDFGQPTGNAGGRIACAVIQ